MKRGIFWLLEFPATRPRAALGLAFILTLAAIAGAARLRVHAGLDAMFPGHDAAAEALVDISEHFQTVDELLVLVTLPSDNDPPNPQRLTAYAGRFERAVSAMAQTKLVEAVIYRSQPDAEQFIERELAPAGLFYLNDADLAAARERLSPAGMRAQLAHDQAMLSQPGPAAGAVSKAMMQDPLGLHDFLTPLLAASRPMRTYQDGDALISPDGRAILIRVIGNRPPSDLAYARALTDAIGAAAIDAAPDGLKVSLAGAYPIAAISQRSIQHDAAESVVGSVLLLAAVFAAAYRRPIGMFLLAFTPVALGTLWGFGAYGVVLRDLSPVAAVIGGVLAGMGIDYSVLYLTCYQTLRFEGADAADAARRTAATIGSAIAAAFITSVAGFLAVGCSTITAMRDFAILGTMGLTGSFLAALWILPALLVLTQWRGHRAGKPAFRFQMTAVMRWAGRYRVALAVVGAALAVTGAAAALAGPGVIRPEADLTVMHPRPNAALDTEEDIGRRFGVSAGTMLIQLRAADERHLVGLAHEVRRRLSSPAMQRAEIAGSYGLATWLPDPEVVAQRGKALTQAQAEKTVADFRAAVNESSFDMTAFEGYSLFLGRLLNPGPAPDIAALRKYPGLARDLLPANAADNTEAVTVVFTTGSEESAADRDREIEALRGALAGLNGATLTGLPVIGHDADRAVLTELPRLLWIAAALVAGYLLLHFREPRQMMLSLLPAAFGLLTLAGIARFAGIRLNMINLVALPLLIGIDVDYGIYLVSLARKTAAQSGAHAVVVCATSMIAGYASLVFTSVPAIQSLGMIVSAGVACCLAGALFLLCPLLGRVE
ncbi:MAG: MMPL family transporter [Tepidisphaeraceae bacterium]